MSDDASQEALSAGDATAEDEQEVVYSDNAEDNKFIHSLIQTVEQYILLQRLRRDASEAAEKAVELQRTYDDYTNEAKLYEKCNEPVLESLIEYSKQEAEEASVELNKLTQKMKVTETALKKNKLRRQQLVRALYEDSERFTRRTLFQGADYGLLEFDVHFHRALIKLKASAEKLDSFDNMYKVLREEVSDSQRQVVATRADPTATEENKALATARRKAALEAKDEEQLRQARRKENQLNRELEFFAGDVNGIFREAQVLPRYWALPQSPSSSSVSKLEVRPREHSGRRQSIATPLHHPKRQALLDARRECDKIREELDILRSEYVEELADTLILHPAVSRRTFDESYTAQHDGQSFTVLEEQLIEASNQADAACSFAWREAVKAGMTDLPPSPVDIGARTDDGYASSMDTQGREALQFETQDVQHTVKQWGKTVAMAGTPVSPSAAPEESSPGKRKLPNGDEFSDRETYEDPSRSHGTVVRAERNRDQYNERFLLQDTKRQKVQHEWERGDQDGERGSWTCPRCAVQ